MNETRSCCPIQWQEMRNLWEGAGLCAIRQQKRTQHLAGQPLWSTVRLCYLLILRFTS